MELAVAFLYVLIAALVWRLSGGWAAEDFRVMAAVFWPLTLVAWIVLGLLLVPFVLLALTGYLNTWWLGRRRGRLREHRAVTDVQR
jgi:hypothetical protein